MATPLCWGKRTCPHCENVAYWDLHYNGSASCTSCGTLSTANAFEGFETTYIHGYSPLNTLQQNAVYTRLKRFQKYLNRASMRQSMNSVPDDTWRYLIDRGPYNSPGHILRTLKKSKLKRKCYDCLPLLTHHLCAHINVPKLVEREYRQALEYFRAIDEAFPIRGSFMSYLFILEFILCELGRPDMLPFISRIHCRKRRDKYQTHLTSVIKDALTDGSLRA